MEIMSNGLNDVLNKLREELANLAKFVDKTRQGIDNLENTVKIGSEKFPDASRQLNAVTGDLENAANNIMTILEGLLQEQDNANALITSLSKWAGSLGDGKAAEGVEILKKLEGINAKTKKEMMDIFTNLSFQDLTGQKLKKVIGSLAVVETKLLELALTFGFNDSQKKSCDEKKDMLDSLKGPTNPMPIDQDLVDKLLKELGT